MLTSQERKNIVEKAGIRIAKNLDKMTPYSRQTYVQKLVNMLDDVHLLALDFSMDMTPELPTEEKKD